VELVWNVQNRAAALDMPEMTREAVRETSGNWLIQVDRNQSKSITTIQGAFMQTFTRAFQFVSVCGAILLIAGCASPANVTPVTKEMIQSHKGDMDGLWEEWIKPQLVSTEEGWLIPIKRGENMIRTEEAFMDEFGRICKAGSGTSTVFNDEFNRGHQNTCTAASGEFVGQIHTARKYAGIRVWIETPKTRNKEEALKRDFENRQQANGPTGWITTEKGRYQFVRLGTLDQRYVISISCNGRSIPLEDIRSIEFRTGAVKMQNGDTCDDTKAKMERIKDPQHIEVVNFTYIPFVLADENEITYPRKDFSLSAIMNSEKILGIQLDDVQAWKDRPGTRLPDLSDYRSLATAASIDELNKLISRFEHHDPKNLIPNARTRLEQLIAARHQRLEHKQIGDQVCVDGEATVNQSTGFVVMGEPQYRKVFGRNHIVGFVEAISGKKIQIRISGINFSGDGINQSLDSVSNWKGGSTLKINSLIWDTTYDWEGC
jgi:hypothetical protein